MSLAIFDLPPAITWKHPGSAWNDLICSVFYLGDLFLDPHALEESSVRSPREKTFNGHMALPRRPSVVDGGVQFGTSNEELD